MLASSLAQEPRLDWYFAHSSPSLGPRLRCASPGVWSSYSTCIEAYNIAGPITIAKGDRIRLKAISYFLFKSQFYTRLYRHSPAERMMAAAITAVIKFE